MNFMDLWKVLSAIKPEDFAEIAGIVKDGVALEQRVKAFIDKHPELVALFAAEVPKA